MLDNVFDPTEWYGATRVEYGAVDTDPQRADESTLEVFLSDVPRLEPGVRLVLGLARCRGDFSIPGGRPSRLDRLWVVQFEPAGSPARVDIHDVSTWRRMTSTPPPRALRVMTWNIKRFTDSNGCVCPDPSDPSGRRRRGPFYTSGRLSDPRAVTQPASSSPTGTVTSSLEDPRARERLGAITRGLIQGPGGVVVLSAFPVVAQRAHVFDACKAEDCLQQKGVLHLRLHLGETPEALPPAPAAERARYRRGPFTPSEDDLLDVFVLHANAPTSTACGWSPGEWFSRASSVFASAVARDGSLRGIVHTLLLERAAARDTSIAGRMRSLAALSGVLAALATTAGLVQIVMTSTQRGCGPTGSSRYDGETDHPAGTPAARLAIRNAAYQTLAERLGAAWREPVWTAAHSQRRQRRQVERDGCRPSVAREARGERHALAPFGPLDAQLQRGRVGLEPDLQRHHLCTFGVERQRVHQLRPGHLVVAPRERRRDGGAQRLQQLVEQQRAPDLDQQPVEVTRVERREPERALNRSKAKYPRSNTTSAPAGSVVASGTRRWRSLDVGSLSYATARKRPVVTSTTHPMRPASDTNLGCGAGRSNASHLCASASRVVSSRAKTPLAKGASVARSGATVGVEALVEGFGRDVDGCNARELSELEPANERADRGEPAQDQFDDAEDDDFDRQLARAMAPQIRRQSLANEGRRELLTDRFSQGLHLGHQYRRLGVSGRRHPPTLRKLRCPDKLDLPFAPEA